MTTTPGADLQAALQIAAGQQRPTLFDGAAQHWPCVRRWDRTYLQETLGDLKIKVYRGRTPLREGARPQEGPSVPAARATTLGEYLEGVGERADEQRGYVTEISLFGDAKRLLTDIRIPVGDLRRMVEASLWVGVGGNRTPMHYDEMDNIYIQVHGAKRFVVAPPTAAGDMALCGPEAPEFQARDSSFRFARRPFVTATGEPDFEDVDVSVFDLSPGDLLYLPAYWFHDVEARSLSLSVNLWSRPRGNHCLNELSLRSVRSMLSGWGTEGVRRMFDVSDPDDARRLADYFSAHGGEPEAAVILRGAVLAP
jgi:Cupin-like domain